MYGVQDNIIFMNLHAFYVGKREFCYLKYNKRRAGYDIIHIPEYAYDRTSLVRSINDQFRHRIMVHMDSSKKMNIQESIERIPYQ
jgi:hypothetical protein